MVGVLGIFKAKGTKVFNEVISRPSEVVGGSISTLLPIKCLFNSQLYGTFILDMVLPLILLGIAALIMIPTALVERRVRRGRTEAAAPAFKGKFNMPRCFAVHKLMRAPMSAEDVIAWGGPFRPVQRFAGITAFLLFFLCVAGCSLSLSSSSCAAASSLAGTSSPGGRLPLTFPSR